MSKLSTMIKLVRGKIAQNVLINIIASATITFTLQIITFPFIARMASAKYFGSVITLYGISNIIVTIFGNSLNNVRLIENERYLQKKLEGDYSILNIVLISASGITMSILVFLYNEVSIFDRLSIIAMTMLGSNRNYATVFFRIQLNYKGILKNSGSVCIGIGLGVLLCIWLHFYTLPLLLGELFGTVNIILSTPIRSERFVQTKEFRHVIKSTFVMSGANTCESLVTYLDRVVILPILGAGSTSLFYTASFASKMFNVMSSPISNVILSYLAKARKESFNSYFLSITIFCMILSSAVLGLLSVFAPIALHILYPQYYADSMKYLLSINLAASISFSLAFISPMILRFCPVSSRLIIQAVNLVVFSTLALILMKLWGLYGYCYALIIGNAIKMIITLGTIKRNLRPMRNISIEPTEDISTQDA